VFGFKLKGPMIYFVTFSVGKFTPCPNFIICTEKLKDRTDQQSKKSNFGNEVLALSTASH
jgi:hypothetical protein